MSRVHGVKYQIWFAPFVFGAQLVFTFTCARDLDPSAFKETMLIIGLSMIFQFSDFGGLFATYISANAYLQKQNKIELIRFLITLKYVLRASFFGIFFGTILLTFHTITLQIFVFLVFSMINQAAAWFLVVTRAFGSELRYSLFYNSSWMLALITLYIFKSLNFNFTNYYFLLPVGSSVILNLATIPRVLRILNKHTETLMADLFKVKSKRGFNKLIFTAFFVHSTGIVSIYCDRYLLNLNSTSTTVNKYIIFAQVAFGCITLTNTMYTLNSRFSTGTDYSDFSITKTFRKSAILFTACQPIGIYFITKFYYKIHYDVFLVILFELFIASYVFLRREQIYFSTIHTMPIQIKGNCLQLTMTPVLYFLFEGFSHEYAILFSIFISVIINFAFLRSRRFALR
jgi:hypothetical protein